MKRAAEAEAVLDLESDSESESNADPGGTEESRGVIRLSGAEWIGEE